MKMKKIMFLVMCILLGGCFAGELQAAPKIDISGIEGGQHWVWVEGEFYDADETTLGGAKTATGSEVSNSNFYSHRNCWGASRYKAGVVNYNIHMPTAMDSNTRIYLRYGAAGDVSGKRTGKVDLDTIEVASLTLGLAGNAYGLPPQVWVDAEVGEISAGDHELNLARDSQMWQTFDGFYLVEGEAAVGSTSIKSTPFDDGTTNRYLMQAPTPVDAYAVAIDANEITPTINVSADAASYQCFLNGEEYTSGTAISIDGNYVLEVYAWDTVNNVYSHSGVNFTLGKPAVDWNLALVDWKFTSSEGWQGDDPEELEGAGWLLSRSAADVNDTDIGCFIDLDNGKSCLTLHDFREDGYPIACYNFGPGLVEANMKMHVGVSVGPGYSNPLGKIALRSGSTVIAYLQMQYHDGKFVHGDGTTESIDVDFGYSSDHNLAWSWVADPNGTGRVSVTLEDAITGEVYVLANNNAFIGDGIPDNILLQCGWPEHPDAYLKINELAILPTVTQPGVFGNPIPGDITGLNGSPDGKVGLLDMEAMATNWLNSSAFVSRPLPPAVDSFFAPSDTSSASALNPDGIYPQGKNLGIGFFAAHNHEDPGSWLKQDGFTLIGPYLKGGIITKASQQQLKVVYSVGMTLDFNDPDFQMPSDTEIQTAISDQVNAVAAHSEIAWWYLTPEELSGWDSNQMHYLQVATDTIHAIDPSNRPVWTYLPGHHISSYYADLMQYLDICGKGIYCNRSGYQDERVYVRASVEREMEAIQLAGNTDAFPIATLEAQDDPGEQLRPLIPSWVRHDAYLSLMTGAKGIDLYMGYRTDAGSFENQEDALASYYNLYYDAWKQVAQELNGDLGLADVFLFGEEREDINVDVTSGPATVSLELKNENYEMQTYTYPSVAFLDTAYGDTRYLFLCNSSNSDVTVSVSGLPESEIRVVDAFSPEEPFVLNTGTMSVDLGALEVKAFRFMAPPENCEDLGVIFLDGDLANSDYSRDCVVDLNDFAILASEWLSCEGISSCEQ